MDWIRKKLSVSPPILAQPSGWPTFLDFEQERLKSIDWYVSENTCARAAYRDPYCTVAVAKLCHASQNRTGTEIAIDGGLSAITDQKLKADRLGLEDKELDLLGVQLGMLTHFFDLTGEVFDFGEDSEVDKIFASLPTVEKARRRYDLLGVFARAKQCLVKMTGLLTNKHLGLAVGIVVLEAHLVQHEPWVVAGQESFWSQVRRTKNLSIDETIKSVCVRVLQQHDANLKYLFEVERKKGKPAKEIASAAPVSTLEAIKKPKYTLDRLR